VEIVHNMSTYVTVFMSKILETLRPPSTFRFFPTKLKCLISNADLSNVFLREVKQSNKTSSFAVLGANGGEEKRGERTRSFPADSSRYSVQIFWPPTDI